MKKVLITGLNNSQCTRDYFLKQEIKVVPSHYSLIRCLEDMGYSVEQRYVELGEDISGYDEVIVYMHSIQAFCQRLFHGLYALSQRPDAILAFDDWQVDQIYKSYSFYRENLEGRHSDPFREYLLELNAGKEPRSTIEKYKSEYKAAIDITLKKDNRLLVSAFDHGNLDLLKLEWQKDRVFRFNPNPYHLNRKFENNYGEPETIETFTRERILPENKKRVWNFSSLVQKKTREWLEKKNSSEWKWDINFYGARRGEEIKQERLVEADMCRIYEEQWGCLMPGYFHSGSGWWRARPLQVADAGSILVCDDKEGKVYGDAYVKLNPSEIEDMSTEQLTRLAKDQHDCLYDNHPLDKKITREEIDRILEASR